MITLGICKEIFYLAKVLNYTYNVEIIGPHLYPIVIIMNSEGIMDIWYNKNHIWTEKVDGEDSFLGVESMDSISRCIKCIDNNSEWKNYTYFQVP